MICSHSNTHLLLLATTMLCSIGYFDFALSAGCIEVEREALLEFKGGLKDPSNRLSSWSGEDCCSWSGVLCDNATGRVVGLDLQNPYKPSGYFLRYPSYFKDEFEAEFSLLCLSGEINSSLLELKHLNRLDLSRNCFQGMEIPKFIGSFKELQYLNLSYADFGGKIPHEVGNLSSLLSLALSSGLGSPELGLDVSKGLFVDQLDWVVQLSALRQLEMNHVNLSMVSDHWLRSINTLPSIQTLHLSFCNLSSIPTSLPHTNFTSLSTLDLSGNLIVGSTFPAWLFNISSITNLDLSSTGLQAVPRAIRSLCGLQRLDLSRNYLGREMNAFKESFDGCLKNSLQNLYLSSNMLIGNLPNWLEQFTNLKVIDFSRNNYSGPIPSSITELSTLTELILSFNSFSGSIPTYIKKLSNLTVLRLGGNSLSGPIPASLGSLSMLRHLDLSSNSLGGPIPASLGSLSSLRKLDLYNNSLSGPFPVHLTNLTSLGDLDVSLNKLSGSIPASIGQMSQLYRISIGRNSFEGVLSEAHFSNLSRLEELFISEMPLVINVSSSWVPPFQFRFFITDGSKLGPQFPQWLRTQKKVLKLSLRNSSISDAIPSWFWNISSALWYVDLSNNFIPSFMNSSSATLAPSLAFLAIPSNRLTESIFPTICQMSALQDLVLTDNYLSGKIPECLVNKSLRVLNLGNNSLTGHIPPTICQMSSLLSLHLANNKLSGELSFSLSKCTSLVNLDIGGNSFSGKIPAWIGQGLTSLRVLNLRANRFNGTIPQELSLLSQLRILDLAQNSLSGAIPSSFRNFSGMHVPKTGESLFSLFSKASTRESAWVFWKGHRYLFNEIAKLMVSIDLSSNNLYGEIPKEITLLHGLKNLNLSNNNLIGSIPKEIGDLQEIESLDLSNNDLSGIIPQSLSYLNFLSKLNLSFNNLSGRIPSGNQLKTLDDPYTYMGNPNLCGFSLPNQCPGDETTQGGVDVKDHKDENSLEVLPFCIAIVLGFVVGFWTFCGTLLLKRSWRIAFCRFCDALANRSYVVAVVAIKVAKFRLKKLGRTVGAGIEGQ